MVSFYFSCLPVHRTVVSLLVSSYTPSLVKDFNSLRSKLSQQSSLKRQKPLTSTKKRPEVFPLVQTTVVVQTLNHNSVSVHWEESLSSLSTAGRTPQCRQVFILSKILCSAKGRDQRQLKDLEKSSSHVGNRYSLGKNPIVKVDANYYKKL